MSAEVRTVYVDEGAELAAERARPVLPLEPLMCIPLPRWKRAMDIVGAMVGVILFSPIMLIAAVAIKLTSRGPVIFKHRRAGRGGRPFTFYKFRSMYANSDESLHLAHLRHLMDIEKHNDSPHMGLYKMQNDGRITPLGQVLRRTSLDELPQLLNVLKGDMSLVGPRPDPYDATGSYPPWYRRRLLMTPGITGLWQVKGRSAIALSDMVRLDHEYARRRSPWLDAWILFRTIEAVFLMRGAR